MRNNRFWDNKKLKKGFLMLFLSGGLLGGFLVFSDTPVQAATKSIKIRYNGKVYKNKSKKMTVKFNGKTVSKKNYKALVIKKKYMVSYYDVLKKGVKAKCSYKKAKKSLSISANGSKLVMKIGKKKATLNGKKVTLPVAPVSVRYISKKKTKILVPVNYVAKALHLSYKKSGSTIALGSPLVLTYDHTFQYYTGVQGKIYYNHKIHNLTSLPVIKINKNMYAPAEEVLKNIMGLEYDYNLNDHKLTIINEDTDKELIMTIDNNNATLNKKSISLSAPAKIIYDNKTKKNIVCIPLAGTLKQLNYLRSWDKKNNYYQIQTKEYFKWNKDLTEQEKKKQNINYLYNFESIYQEHNKTGFITFRLAGSQTNILKTATINRSSNVITITIPDSKYSLDKNLFSKFGEIIKKMEVTEKNSSVEISFTCENVADYSYVFQNNVLEFNILYSYGNKDGSVINNSLSIPKPAGITINQVTNEDLYASHMFKIYIPGDQISFYQNNPVVINNSSITNLAITKSGNQTVITVTTSKLVGYKIYEEGNCFNVKIGNPASIYKNILVLDAGHGGHDPGAQNNGTNEKDLTYKIIYTLMKGYFSSNASDIKVYWTRTNDTFVTLADRAAFAKSVGADAFISLHMNSASNKTANGTEVYYSVSNNNTSFSGINSQKMANLFKTQLVTDLKTKNRGTKTAAYYVLKHNTVPSILIELGFISGNSDYSNLVNPAFQENAAKSIYTGIVSMFNSYPTGR